jgi:hypothetical protein
MQNSLIDISLYEHKLFVYPKNTPAKFYGLGSFGCFNNTCLSWYNMDTYNSALFLHELGHNFGLDHSRTIDNEYGDVTCVTGNTPNRCWNAPHRYVLGWSEPVESINLVNLTRKVLISSTLRAGEFLKLNDHIFLEHLNFLGNETIPSMLLVHWLDVNMTTSLLCKLQNSQACTIHMSTAITFKVIDISQANMQFSIDLGHHSSSIHNTGHNKMLANIMMIYCLFVIAITCIKYNT